MLCYNIGEGRYKMVESKKHPQYLTADNRPVTDRQSIPGGSGASVVLNTNKDADGYSVQQDIYFNSTPDIAGQEIASLDGVYRKNYTLGNIYYKTDGRHLNETSNGPDGKVYTNTENPDIKAYADKINELMEKDPFVQINIKGHASKTSNPQHNMDLSVDRAKNVYEGEDIKDANGNPIIHLKGIIDYIKPEFRARLHNDNNLKTDAVGDTDLAIKTDKENGENRNVEISAYYMNTDNADRGYRVYHIDKKFADLMSQRNFGLDVDMGMTTELSVQLQQNRSSISLPAHGTVLLETDDLKSPVKININPNQAEDFRFMVKDAKGDITYRIEKDNNVLVFEDGREIASIKYNLPNGATVTENDIYVGKAISQSDGKLKTELGTRDLAGELFDRIDRNHDGKISKQEIDQENKYIKLRELTDSDKVKAITDANAAAKYYVDRVDRIGNIDLEKIQNIDSYVSSHMMGTQYIGNRGDFTAAIMEGGHTQNGALSINYDEIKKQNQKDKLFTDAVKGFSSQDMSGGITIDKFRSVVTASPVFAEVDPNAQDKGNKTR